MNKFQALREQFPATKDGVFLDVAYDNSGSDLAVKALTRYIRELHVIEKDQQKFGGAGRGKGAKAVVETRKLIAEFLGGVDPSCIAFTKNTNEGISNVLLGFPFEEGDNIITCEIEHPSVIMPCLAIANCGVECRVIPSADGISITPEELLAVADPHTRFIVVSHVQSATGYKIDLEKLCRLAHEKGIYVLVDAIQSLGFTICDVAKWQPDLITAAGYKGLLAIDGIGFMYCAHGLLEKVMPPLAASNDGLCIDKSLWKLGQAMPDNALKFENSSMNIAGIYALNAGIRTLMDIGMEQIDAHIGMLFHKLYDGLTALGYTVVTPRERCHSSHSVSTLFPDPADAYAFFMEQGIHISFSAGKYIRASIPAFANEQDIDKMLEVAKMYREK